MKTPFSRLLLGALVSAGALLAVAQSNAQTTTSATNYIEFGAGAAWTGGDSTAFQARTGLARKGFGGISDFHYANDWDGLTITAEGHALAGNNDYLVDLKAAMDKFELHVLFREFRTWHDGTGEYLPYAATVGGRPNVSLGKGLNQLDRSEFAIEGTYKPFAKLTLGFGYRRLERDGTKPSTIEGATFLTAIPYGRYDTVGTPSNSSQRNIVPAFLRIAEKRDIFDVRAALDLDTTKLGAGLRWESSDLNNTRNWNMNPFEWTSGNPNRFLTQRDGSSADLFSVHLSDVNKLNEILTLTAGYAYRRIKNTIDGSRTAGAAFDSSFNPAFVGPTGRTTLGGTARADSMYKTLGGLTEETEKAGNIALIYQPAKRWEIVPSLRVARVNIDAVSNWIQASTATVNSAGAVVPGTETSRIGDSEHGTDQTTAAIETRYQAGDGWVLSARAQTNRESIDIEKTNPVQVSPPPTATQPVAHDTLHKRRTDRIRLAANWHYMPGATFAFVYDYHWRKNSFEGESLFVRKQSFETSNWSARMTLRTMPNVTYVARYDMKRTDINNGSVDNPIVRSANLRTNMISQALTWTPANWIYVQATLNYVKDRLDTPANEIADPPPPLPAAFSSVYSTTSGLGTVNGVIPDEKNNYWNGLASVGFVVDEDSDIVISYERNTVSNWYDNSIVSVPYGASYRDRVYRVSANRQFGPNIRVSGEYAYIKSTDTGSGRTNDFDASIVSGKIQYRF